MKLTNGEIFNAKEPLTKLMGEKFPVKVSYQLAKLAGKLSEQMLVIEKVRNGLIQTYGEPNPDNPQQISVLPNSENFQKFASELGELFAQEIQVVFEVVKLPEMVASTCDQCKHNMDRPLEIEPYILLALDKFVEMA